MNLEEISGPGVEAWLIEYLRAWGIKMLTDIQIQAFGAGIADGRAMIVSAPTSSGKTLVGEIAVLAALRAGVRAIYLVSHKALADQKYLDFIARFGENAAIPIASVGLNTGDRTEGDINAQLMIATYEKALGLILAGQLKPADALIVADELQILGEPGRGPEIETLCAVLKQRGIKQFVALTATVENPEDLAGWMGCELVRSYKRDVPLYQEIWYSKHVYQTLFGQDEGHEIKGKLLPKSDITGVVNQLLDLGRGPVLVFTESRREATEYAVSFGQNRPRVGDGIILAEQLDLFSEPTESSEQLRHNAERRVAFHSADLSPQERQVIEAGFLDSKFEVCFATSTLAAGVNFPFRSIVFPKLTFQWGDRSGKLLPRTDYRNMSGRAGRLGMHNDGYSVLLPKNELEFEHAKQLIMPTNDRLISQLVTISLRKSILTLVASHLGSSFEEVMKFFRETLYWYQTLQNNPKKLINLETNSKAAIAWLIEHELIHEEGENLIVTQFGNATALSGLLPSTAVQISKILKNYSTQFDQSFNDWIDGIIYALCASDEFRGDRPSRFLPYPGRVSYDSVTFWTSKKLPIPLDRTDIRLAQCAQAIVLYVEGLAERKIAHVTNLSSGAIHRLAIELAWVLDGVHKIASVPDLDCSQILTNQIAMLARRVHWGSPVEALDVIRVAEKHGVPGFGRQRAMALVAQGIATLHDVLATAKEKLTEILRSDRRAIALIEAASSTIGHSFNRLKSTHSQLAKELGLGDLLDSCNNNLGVEYEKAITDLLRVETSWIVTALDDGTRQNVPDIFIRLGECQLLVECKTCSKSPPLIKKEEAWAVLQKASDFDKTMHRITLGKPGFDETSKKKSAASHDITLVEHNIFLEGLLRVHAGSLTPSDFLKWLTMPGVAEIERLGGTPTYSL
jgi:helicase